MDTAFTAALMGAGWLVFYGWQVFVKDRGNIGSLGLPLSVFAWWSIADWLFDT